MKKFKELLYLGLAIAGFIRFWMILTFSSPISLSDVFWLIISGLFWLSWIVRFTFRDYRTLNNFSFIPKKTPRITSKTSEPEIVSIDSIESALGSTTVNPPSMS